MVEKAANDKDVGCQFERTGAWAVRRGVAVRPISQAGLTKLFPVSGDEGLQNVVGWFQDILRRSALRPTDSVVGSVWSVLLSYETVNHCDLIGTVHCRTQQRSTFVLVRTFQVNFEVSSRLWCERTTQRAAGHPFRPFDTNTVPNTAFINDDSIIRNGHDAKQTDSFRRQFPIVLGVLLDVGL